MKNSLIKTSLLLFISLFLISIYSCDDSIAPNGDLSFSFNLKQEAGVSRSLNLDIAKSILITLSQDNEVIYEKLELELTKFNGNYISEAISLIPGNYNLEEFLVLDESNNTLYATPKEDSDLAYLVDQPLPIDIEITSENITSVSPEVIEVGSNTPQEFGYLNFTALQVVETLDVLVSVIRGTEDSYELTTSNIKITDSNSEEEIVSSTLDAGVNILRLPKDVSNFDFKITKSGHQTILKSYSSEELSNYVEDKVLTLTLILEEGLSPIASFYFDNNIEDLSGYDNQASSQNIIFVDDRNGNTESAISLNGDGFVEIQNSDLFDVETDANFSISIWVAPSSTQNNIDGTSNAILSKWDGEFSTGYPFGLWYYNSTAGEIANKVSIQRFGSNYCSQLKVQEVGNEALGINEWNHLVFVQEDGISKLYQNNVLVAEVNDPTSGCEYMNNDEPIRLGYRKNNFEGAFRHFTGKIDDFKLFNRALTIEEINTLFTE